eukprot:TRINITY_DN104109_c0_g1_i1.p1 TRINITY_DN104109_c0_g1~~TRINITY_DN104109_c0_g1_i1.p1  ORF type:complete len:409 (-),score=33.35 TRINITY_DN104109_c0_g1_i1:191-1417(-)
MSMSARAMLRHLALFVACPATADAGIPYKLSKSMVGTDFFSNWWFWKDADPTRGFVQYTEHDPAMANGLIDAQPGWAYIGVDSKTILSAANGPGRGSVRITSNEKYSHGLFIITVAHMPTGCGTWPAFWMFGEDPPAHIWPDYGEYDIIEGVNVDSAVKTTLHTKKGCDQSYNVKPSDFTGSWVFPNCDIRAGFGCQQIGPEDSFGQSLNRNGGGTFAAEWDPKMGRFRTWFWRAGSEPADVLARSPTLDYWGVPFSYFQMTDPTCPANPNIFKERTVCPTDYFKEMRLVLNTALCGDWAGENKTWAAQCGKTFPGMTCNEVVAASPDVLKDSYWNITRLDVYQRDEYRYALSEQFQAPCPHSRLVWWIWPAAGGLAVLVIGGFAYLCMMPAVRVVPEQTASLLPAQA